MSCCASATTAAAWTTRRAPARSSRSSRRRPRGRAPGSGSSVAYGVVDALGGSLAIASRAGRGHDGRGGAAGRCRSAIDPSTGRERSASAPPAASSACSWSRTGTSSGSLARDRARGRRLRRRGSRHEVTRHSSSRRAARPFDLVARGRRHARPERAGARARAAPDTPAAGALHVRLHGRRAGRRRSSTSPRRGSCASRSRATSSSARFAVCSTAQR